MAINWLSSSLALRERLYGFRKSNHRLLGLNWVSITITYTFWVVPLKMHFYSTFDSNSASKFKRLCDFFQLSEVVFLVWSAFSVYLGSWYYNHSSIQLANPTSTIRNGFVVELKQKEKLENQFTFLKSTVSLVPAVLL